MATYTRQELVGRGGMAEVWRGQMTTEGGATRTVALKFILPRLAGNEALLSAFRSEAQLSMHLSHGNVVQVFDFGQLEGRWFLAMEWVDGTSLWKVLQKAKARGLGAVHPVMAAQVLMAVLDGLHHAHTRLDDGKPLKLVHRDVSPDNVLVSWDGQVKVADFGIARAAMQGRQETQPGIFKGKLAYGAPEQARAEPVDARADVYAAGVMLWELVTGQNPVAKNAVDIASGRERIAAFDPQLVDARFADLVDKAVARQANSRFPSAKAFRDALSAWLRSQPASRLGPAELMAWLFPDRVSSPELKNVGQGTGQWLLRWKPNAATEASAHERVTTQGDAPRGPPRRAVLGLSVGLGLLVLALALLPSSARPPVPLGDRRARPLEAALRPPDGQLVLSDVSIQVEQPPPPEGLVPTGLTEPEPQAAPPAPDSGRSAEQLIDEALALSSSGALREAQRTIDTCRSVAPTEVRCLLVSGSVYSKLAAVEGNDPGLLEDARGFYARFVKEACPGHAACIQAEAVLAGRMETRGVVRGAANSALGARGPLDGVDRMGALVGGRMLAAGGSSEPEIMGSLAKELVRKVIDSNRGQIQRCYKLAQRRAPELAGKVAVVVVISTLGSPVSARVVGSTANNADLEACIASRVGSWRFPRPHNGGAVVTAAFSFPPPP